MEKTMQYTGIVDDMVQFITEKQLKRRDLWHLAAEQFAGTPDDEDDGWRGEYWGKLMRGACIVYEYTQDEELYTILTETVHELISYADEAGRISAYSRQREFHGWDMWARKYVLLGLIHFHEICKDSVLQEQVIDACCKHLDYIIGKIGPDKLAITDTSEIWGGINSSSILEPVVRLYRLTNEERYLTFAKYIINNGGAKGFNIFEAAYEDQLYPYQYEVVKAYELMSCFEGLLEYYNITGEEKWRTAVENFAKRLIESEITVAGSAGCKHELFNHSALMQTYSGYDGLMQETCVTVTWMKLCYRMYLLTGESRYADEIEKSAWNALYGSVNTEEKTCGDEATFDLPYYREVYDRYTARKGAQPFDSYSPLRRNIRGKAVGGFKAMENRESYCGCCIAIGAAGLGLVPQSGVQKTESGYRIAQYIPGSVCFADSAKFTIQTEYPTESEIAILVDAEGSFDVELRIPYFSEQTEIKVNGQAMENIHSGSFYAIHRDWKKGDRIEICMDMNPRIVHGQKNPEDALSERYVAVLYGPLLLARDARLGGVGEAFKVDESKLSVKKVQDCGVAAQGIFDVCVGDRTIRMMDYASAGKTWRRDSEMEAWLLTE